MALSSNVTSYIYGAFCCTRFTYPSSSPVDSREFVAGAGVRTKQFYFIVFHTLRKPIDLLHSSRIAGAPKRRQVLGSAIQLETLSATSLFSCRFGVLEEHTEVETTTRDPVFWSTKGSRNCAHFLDCQDFFCL
jgi:hypothetical protein